MRYLWKYCDQAQHDQSFQDAYHERMRILPKDIQKIFPSKSKFNRHTNSKPIKCPLCRTSIKCRLLREKHRQEQHPDRFKCKKCGIVDNSYISLRAHEKSHVGMVVPVSWTLKIARKNLLHKKSSH